MRILVLGAGGMLGHKLLGYLQTDHEAWGTVRRSASSYERYGVFDTSRLVSGVDAASLDTVIGAMAKVRPECVVNCIGIIKQLEQATNPLDCIGINSYFPHRLAMLCRASGAKLVHISTDCVFSGRKGMYTEGDISDAEDLYGRSKFLGEVTGECCLTIRTSIIGRELNSRNGLVEWFLGSAGRQVNGFTQALYTGFTTQEMCRIIESVIVHGQSMSGLYNVSSNPISKYDLLCLLKDAHGLDVEIRPVDEPRIDRSLDSTRFRTEMGYVPPSWPDLVKEMAADPVGYGSF